MQHHAVADGQHHVHPVDRQQHYPAQVAGAQDQRAESEEHDERDGHRAHVAGEAARPRAEVEEAEHQRGYDGDGQQAPVDERHSELVEVEQRQQHGERVAPGDAVDAVHEVPGVDYAHEQHQRHEHVPPGEAAAEEAELQEHQGHGGELGHKADGVGQRAHVVGELNGCEQYQPEDEPGVAEAAEQEEEDGRQREYDSPAADGGPGVGAAPVGPVDYPEARGQPEIKQLREKQGCENDGVCKCRIHCLPVLLKLAMVSLRPLRASTGILLIPSAALILALEET